MSNNLVIVESPAKAKTIQKFLGKSYKVIASNGHVRDLPKSTLGVSPENGYEPKYITIRGKGEILAQLRKEVKKADKIYLATDPDREGEAISWHLTHALKLEDKNYHRITFNEITKDAVKRSIKNCRDIDMDLVDAQQARRVLDRVVGYKISPILWSKIKRGLSAGRVQSVALRIINDRETEINEFIPTEYWSLDADLQVDQGKKPIEVHFLGDSNGKMEIHNREEMDQLIKNLEGLPFEILSIKHGERKKKSPLPFTTSTLQQEAAHKLNMSTQKTMRLAQELYEGVTIKGRGTVGLITYLRTDSTRISEEADANCRKYIGEAYGEEYIGQGSTKKASTGKIQDAHEAIRPTDSSLSPAVVKSQLSRDLFRLYQLIWSRFLASRMAEAEYETLSIKIGAGDYRFSVATSHLKFAGFMTVYQDEAEKSKNNAALNKLTTESKLTLQELKPAQHFTQPAPHYTEASLVKTLEELGIGRPSTYAPTITVLLARHYVVKENKNLYMTELGEAVNEMMTEAFPSIVNVNFTASMESLLDGVELGKVKWKTIVENFYPDLIDAVEKAEAELEKVKIADEVSDEICEECGRNMVIKYGPHGKFLACPGFPECRNTKPHYEKIGVPCPNCGKDIVFKKTKKGRKFYGCINNPECDFMSWQKPSATPCPECGSYMVEKGKKLVCSNPECGYVTQKNE
ncbi:MAG: type I DNA topoisomerase [Eubacteriales bacterium]|nr:type I DNA topoisomerase [Eubacteriales bacterium]